MVVLLIDRCLVVLSVGWFVGWSVIRSVIIYTSILISKHLLYVCKYVSLDEKKEY